MLEILILYIQATFKNSFPAIQDVHGLAEQVRNGNKTFPSLYCTNDEYQPLSGNENFLYFRQLGPATEGESDEESVSGCDHYVTRTYPMVAIAYIPKNVFNTDNAFIDSKIAGNIANILRVANYGTLMASMKADDIHAEVTRISTDRYEVWDQEFKGIDMAARFDHVLCAVEFDLIVSATERCLQNYDCNDETVTVEGDTIVVDISDPNAWHKDGDFLSEIKQIGATNAVNWHLIHGGAVKATVMAAGLNIPAIVGDVALTGNLVVTGSIDYTSGAIQSLNGLTDKTQVFAIGSAGTDFNLVSAAGVHTFNIPDAGVGITGGLVNNAAQTFEGAKTFASAPILTGFTQGSVLFVGVGGVVSQDNPNFKYDSTARRLTLGGTLNVELDFNSGANAGRITMSASGLLVGTLAGLPLTFYTGASEKGRFTSSGQLLVGNTTGSGRLNVWGAGTTSATWTAQFHNSTGANNAHLIRDDGSHTFNTATVRSVGGLTVNGNVFPLTSGVSQFGGSGFRWNAYFNLLDISNYITNLNIGSTPATVADAHLYYSRDVVAGNAAPHFRTENGDILRIFANDNSITASAFVANTSGIADDTATFGGFTIGQIAAALVANGFLK